MTLNTIALFESDKLLSTNKRTAPDTDSLQHLHLFLTFHQIMGMVSYLAAEAEAKGTKFLLCQCTTISS